jgi:hypothetical protein
MARKLYDPQLTPEREVMKEKNKLLNEMKQVVRLTCTRSGEQYFLGCKCRAYQVTNDPRIAHQFMIDHISC